MPTAYLHLNGTDYELPGYLAAQRDQLAKLAELYGSFVARRPPGHQVQDVVVQGAPAALVINKASVTTAAVYVVGGEPLAPPNLL